MKKALFTLFSVGTLLFNSYALPFKTAKENEIFQKTKDKEIKSAILKKSHNDSLVKKILDSGYYCWNVGYKKKYVEINLFEYAKKYNLYEPYTRKIRLIDGPLKKIMLSFRGDFILDKKTNKITEMTRYDFDKYYTILTKYKKKLVKIINFTPTKEANKIFSENYNKNKLKNLKILYEKVGRPDLRKEDNNIKTICKMYTKLTTKNKKNIPKIKQIFKKYHFYFDKRKLFGGCYNLQNYKNIPYNKMLKELNNLSK